MKTILAVLMCALLTACASLGPSPEQIKAMQGTSSSFCVEVGPQLYGAATTAHYVSFGGKSTGTAGGGGDATCGKSTMKFDNDGKAGATAPATTTTTTTKVTP